MNDKPFWDLRRAAMVYKPVDQDHVSPFLDERKFAELIIQKCLEFIEPMPGSGDIEDLRLERARDEIKEYFGVKE